jgi:ADP-ribosylglycohydrolase
MGCEMHILDKVYGCLIGGAMGDALGASVEGWN